MTDVAAAGLEDLSVPGLLEKIKDNPRGWVKQRSLLLMILIFITEREFHKEELLNIPCAA